MNILVAVDRNWGIGCQGKLLVSLKEDMQQFRRLTGDGILIYGRKTLATFPGGKPLPGRTNLVLTRNPAFEAEGAIICLSLDALGRQLAREPNKNVWVIGGESIYQQLLPFCRFAFVTQVDQAFPADAYFPNLLEESGWDQISQEPWQQTINRLHPRQESIRFRYCKFRQETCLNSEQLIGHEPF